MPTENITHAHLAGLQLAAQLFTERGYDGDTLEQHILGDLIARANASELPPPAGCDDAFADRYSADPADPAVANDLAVWQQSWAAALAGAASPAPEVQHAEFGALRPDHSGGGAELVEALDFYAQGNHLLLADPDAWDTCSGEPMNFLHDEAGTASVEDGSIAKATLAAYRAQSSTQQGDEVRRLREALDAAEIAVSASESALRHLLHNIRASGKRVDLGLAPSSADEALRRIGQYKRTALSAQGEGERT